MATYLFRIKNKAMDWCDITGTGADLEEATTDAEAKWDAVVTDPDLTPRQAIVVVSCTADAPEFKDGIHAELVP